ncbi:MAG: class I SAM-dependent methyltransferase [Gammaproteobacteria bacterium]|nr:class I SAM-dependent methyltransferase [Gammaproteobacteria bacterium]
MRSFDGLKKTGIDSSIEDYLEEHIKKYNISPLETLKFFPVLARRQWLKRFLAHVELFKLTLDVPGDIAELGVFRGLGLMTWANLLEAYCIGDRTKVVWGFDNWQGFTDFSPEDGQEVKNANKVVGGFNPEPFYNELNSAIEIYDMDRFVSWKKRIHLVNGNIEETVNHFTQENPGVRFSLIHFDCDLYKPTKAALDIFWPLVSRGGVVMFDEYGIHDWPGETKAVDEFLERNPDVKLKTFTWTNTPAAYLIKE